MTIIWDIFELLELVWRFWSQELSHEQFLVKIQPEALQSWEQAPFAWAADQRGEQQQSDAVVRFMQAGRSYPINKQNHCNIQDAS